jgi:SET domain-containing protein
MQSAAMKDEQNTIPLYEPSPDFTGGWVGWTVIPGKGKSVIALKNIPDGTVLEKAPVIIVDQKDMFRPDGSRLPFLDYAFWWGELTDAEKPDQYAIVKAGFLALTNHDTNGNSTIEQDRPNECIEWRAIRDIVAGEEITFDYDCVLWFNPVA